MEGIPFTATLARITSTIDGGWKVTFDVGAHEVQQIMQLAQFIGDTLLQIGVVPFEANRAREDEQEPVATMGQISMMEMPNV